MNIENTILSNLVLNETFSRKVIPHIDPDYFEDDHEKIAAHLILNHYKKYNKPPTKQTLKIDLEAKSLPENLFEKSAEIINELRYEPVDEEWLMNSTEEFCKKRALHNALLLAVEKYDSGDETGQIPDILQKALGVSFDTHIGHDYFEDAAARFEFYNRADNKIPFDIDLLNKITNGGVSKKTMNLLIASTGVGKSMGLCHLSAAYINEGYNVLYISLEMAEEALAERIDANLFDVDIALVRKLSESNFNEKVNKTRKKASGKLIFKEYPTGSAHSGHFRHLLSELKTKKKFIPDVLVIDYLNICASAKFKTKTSMYEYVKSIAEELRGLAVEHDLILWTATQTNREGYSTSDFDLTAVSESMGISHTCDIILALISTDELEQQKLLKVKQLKNRYGDKNYYGSFVVGIDRSKMRIMDAEASAQTTVSQTENDTREKPVEDKKAKIAAMFGS